METAWKYDAQRLGLQTEDQREYKGKRWNDNLGEAPNQGRKQWQLFDPGINTHFVIRNIEKVQTKGADGHYLRLSFLGAREGDNRSAMTAIFDPTKTFTNPNYPPQPIEKIRTNVLRMQARVHEIFRALGYDIGNFEWNSFEEFCGIIQQHWLDLPTEQKKTLLKGIFVYNNKGYLQLRNNYYRANILPMHNPERLVIDKARDILRWEEDTESGWDRILPFERKQETFDDRGIGHEKSPAEPVSLAAELLKDGRTPYQKPESKAPLKEYRSPESDEFEAEMGKDELEETTKDRDRDDYLDEDPNDLPF